MPVLAGCAVPHPPIIVPAVGKGEERVISKTIEAYREVARRIAALQPDTLVIMSPHATAYLDYFHIAPGPGATGDLSQFNAPQTRCAVDYDQELVAAICRQAADRDIPAGTEGEKDPSLDHGTMVPLSFICEQIPRPRIVRLGLSWLPPLTHYRLGEAIAAAADKLGRRIVFVASGDLSHRLSELGSYGYDPAGPQFDEQVTQAFASGDFGVLLRFEESFCEAAGECGLRSFITMAGALDGRPVSSELLSHEGPWGVGYGVAWFSPKDGTDPRRRFGQAYVAEQLASATKARAGQDPLVQLARFSIEHRLSTGRAARWPSDVPAELLESLPDEASGARAGAFVSLHKDGRLRGCIGTILPTASCLGEEIVRNAVSAALDDPRFDPVTPSELPRLIYSVDVLSAPEPIAGPDELDPARYGVIVSCGNRRGLLLPDLDGVDTVDQQIDIARRKGGIGAGEPYRLERFTVVRHT